MRLLPSERTWPITLATWSLTLGTRSSVRLSRWGRRWVETSCQGSAVSSWPTSCAYVWRRVQWLEVARQETKEATVLRQSSSSPADCRLPSITESTWVAAFLTAATLSCTRVTAIGARCSVSWSAENIGTRIPSCSVNSNRNLQLRSLSIFRNSSRRGRYEFLSSSPRSFRKSAKCFSTPILT